MAFVIFISIFFNFITLEKKKENIIIYGYSMLRGNHSHQDLKINLFFLKL